MPAFFVFKPPGSSVWAREVGGQMGMGVGGWGILVVTFKSSQRLQARLQRSVSFRTNMPEFSHHVLVHNDVTAQAEEMTKQLKQNFRTLSYSRFVNTPYAIIRFVCHNYLIHSDTVCLRPDVIIICYTRTLFV